MNAARPLLRIAFLRLCTAISILTPAQRKHFLAFRLRLLGDSKILNACIIPHNGMVPYWSQYGRARGQGWSEEVYNVNEAIP